jgi:hypothetical protein
MKIILPKIWEEMGIEYFIEKQGYFVEMVVKLFLCSWFAINI